MPEALTPALTSPRWGWLPSSCQVCGAWPAKPWGQAVCADCLGACRPFAARCPVCASVLPNGPHTPCTHPHPAHSPTVCVAAVDYDQPWDGLLARFKFQGETAWARWFAQLMSQAPGAEALLAECDVVLPIPMTPAKLGERGYNQAWLLAKALGQLGHVPHQRLLPQGLLKVRNTATQHELDRAQRWDNLRSAFAVAPDTQSRVAHKRVLLVDDIMTTGSTLRAAAHTLTMAGAARVSALVLARTPTP